LKHCERRDQMNRYLTVNRAEFNVTYLCNGRCRHCSAQDRGAYPEHIDKSLAMEIVRRIGERYSPESVMTFGGEPLLFPEVVYAIHREATDSGIRCREVITNGYWSGDDRKTKEIAKGLAESGVNEINISVDAFHQEHIPLDIVRKTAEACLEARVGDLAWNPCWLVSEEDDNQYNQRTRAILKELEDLPVRTSKGNVVEPLGWALINLKEFLPSRRAIPSGRCGDMPYASPLDSVKSISVEPDGKVAVCNDLHIGNASRTDIIDIIENYDPFEIPEMKAILENGMKGLLDRAEAKGVKPDPEGYHSICHMCIEIRKKVSQSSR